MKQRLQSKKQGKKAEEVEEGNKTIPGSNDKGYSFEKSCVLRWWESETLKQIINRKRFKD